MLKLVGGTNLWFRILRDWQLAKRTNTTISSCALQQKPSKILENSSNIPDACAFESDFLNTYEKSRIHRHVAVAIVIMFMPEVPDYTVTFISSL